MAGELGDELLGIGLGLLGSDVKLFADAVADNFPQRSVAVGGLKNSNGSSGTAWFVSAA